MKIQVCVVWIGHGGVMNNEQVIAGAISATEHTEVEIRHQISTMDAKQITYLETHQRSMADSMNDATKGHHYRNIEPAGEINLTDMVRKREVINPHRILKETYVKS